MYSSKGRRKDWIVPWNENCNIAIKEKMKTFDILKRTHNRQNFIRAQAEVRRKKNIGQISVIVQVKYSKTGHLENDQTDKWHEERISGKNYPWLHFILR